MSYKLKRREEEFRNTHIGWLEEMNEGIRVVSEEALIAEIRWARENPPLKFDRGAADHALALALYARDGEVWQSALDHLLACLGEK